MGWAALRDSDLHGGPMDISTRNLQWTSKQETLKHGRHAMHSTEHASSITEKTTSTLCVEFAGAKTCAKVSSTDSCPQAVGIS